MTSSHGRVKSMGGSDVIVTSPHRRHIGDFLPKISKVELDFGNSSKQSTTTTSSLYLRHQRLIRHQELQRHQVAMASSLPALPTTTSQEQQPSYDNDDVTILKLNLQRHRHQQRQRRYVDNEVRNLMTSSKSLKRDGSLQVGDLMKTYPPVGPATDDAIVSEYDVIKRDFLQQQQRRRVDDDDVAEPLPPPPVSSPVMLGECEEPKFLESTENGVFHAFGARGRHQVVTIDEIIPAQEEQEERHDEEKTTKQQQQQLPNPSSNFKIFIATKRRSQQQRSKNGLLRHQNHAPDVAAKKRGDPPEIGNLLVKSYQGGSPSCTHGAATTTTEASKPVDQTPRRGGGDNDVIVSMTYEATSHQRRRKKFDDERKLMAARQRKFKVKNFDFPLVTSFDQICHGIRHHRRHRGDVTNGDDVTTNESLERFKIESSNCASLSSPEGNSPTANSAPPTSHPLYDELYTKRKINPHSTRLTVRKVKSENHQEKQENQKRQIPVYSLSMLRVNEEMSLRHNRTRHQHQQPMNGVRISNFLPPRPVWSTNNNSAGGGREIRTSSWDLNETFRIHGDASFHHQPMVKASNDVTMTDTTSSTTTVEVTKEETRNNNKKIQHQQKPRNPYHREFLPPGVANGSSSPGGGDQHYADPCSLAPSNFQHRLNELNQLQLETIKYERYKRNKKKRF